MVGWVGAFAFAAIIYYFYNPIYVNVLYNIIMDFDVFNFTIYCDGVDDVINEVTNDSNINSSDTNDSKISKPIIKHNDNTTKIILEVKDDVVDKVIDGVKEVMTEISSGLVDKVIMGAGAAAAGGKAAVAGLNLPGTPLQKLGMAAGAAAVTSGAVMSSLHAVNAVVKNKMDNERLLNQTDADRIPSPTDNTFISSLLDKGDIHSPLQDLLNIQIQLQIYLIIVIILFIALLFNKFLANRAKYTLFKYINYFSNKDSYVVNNVEGFVNKYFKTMFILLSVLAIFLISVNFLISCEINYRLDEYIRVHNDIFKSILVGISLDGGYSRLNYKNYHRAANKLTRENLIKVNNFISPDSNNTLPGISDSNKNLPGVSESFRKIIKDRASDGNIMPGYRLLRSFDNINFLNETENFMGDNEDMNDSSEMNLDQEFGIINMAEIKFGFVNLLEELVEGNLYKLIFRWNSVGTSDDGDTTVEYNTSPSIIIHKNSDIEVLLYKFMSYSQEFDLKYGFGGVINLDIFGKEWIDDEQFNTFNQILNRIKVLEKNSKGKIRFRKVRGNFFSGSNGNER